MQVAARSILLVVAKQEDGFWPRLQRQKGKTPQNIKVDWSKARHFSWRCALWLRVMRSSKAHVGMSQWTLVRVSRLPLRVVQAIALLFRICFVRYSR